MLDQLELPFNIPSEVLLLSLMIVLLVVPRMLQRWRLPAPLTCFALGLIAALLSPDQGSQPIVAVLATLGISTLFLFAGLEVDLADFKSAGPPLALHMAFRVLSVGLLAWAVQRWPAFGWNADWRGGVLLALAVLTPSAGFILDTLPALQLDDNERLWIRMKAITGEIFALILLFIVLQSGSAMQLAGSSAALAALIVLLPLAMRALGRWVLPYAPGSAFSLLVMTGVIAAYVTYRLGVYYLVGAFLAGFVARLLRRRIPALASDEILHAVRLFASFFVPFYFFNNGAHVPSGALTWGALGLGIGLAALVLPLRVGIVWLQRRVVAKESALASWRVAAALTPTLIFTLVLATILRERFGLPDMLYGALLVYAAIATILPSLMMSRPVDFDLLPDQLPEARA